ncbi:MAG: hypothetical protein AAFN70_19085, partial [Planctomycetota bacterium]
MEINVPIYLTQNRVDGIERIEAMPLFHREPVVRGNDVARTIAKFSVKLRPMLLENARQMDQSSLTHWHCDEMLEHRSVKLNLRLRDSTAQLRLLLVQQRWLSGNQKRYVVFSPSIPDLWFDWFPEKDNLETRALEVFEAHYRNIRKTMPEYDVSGDGISSKAWIDAVQLDIPFRCGVGRE